MPDIRHMIQAAASPDRVYALASSGSGLAEWWAEDVFEEGDHPGTVTLGFFNRSTVYRLRPQRMEPGKHAEWLVETGKEWGGTRLLFSLEARGEGTVLRFSHAGWREETEYFVQCNTTWGALMFRLQAAAEGKHPGPLFVASGFGER